MVGGERWWQVRGLDGIDSEWITEKEYLNDASLATNGNSDVSQEEKLITRMEHLETVMVCRCVLWVIVAIIYVSSVVIRSWW